MRNSIDLRGKTIFISGAGAGLGKALVEKAHALGCLSIWAGLRKGASPLPSWSRLVDQGALSCVPFELTCSESMAEAASKIPDLDILINNAAICNRGSIVNDSIDEMRHEFEVNYFGQIAAIQTFLPSLKRRQGLIVNVASQLVHSAVPAIGNYCATKSALLTASQAMRGDLAACGVSVCVVCPGALDTKMSRPFPTKKQDPLEAASEIFKALEVTEGMVPIGQNARSLFEILAHNPLAAERAKRHLTYSFLWPE